MWLFVALSAYFLNAGVYVADKFLLSKKLHSSIAYAFYVGVWSIFNFSLLVFDPYLPDLRHFLLDLLAGLLFLLTLVFWYKALHQSEATRVVPIVGALVPVFSLLLSYIFLGEALSERQFLAFVFLIIGGFLMSVKQARFYYFGELSDRFRHWFGDIFGPWHAHYRPTRRLIFNSLAAALLFAAYYVLIKYVYTQQPFIGGFVWSRFGTFVGVLLMLLVPAWRAKIRENKKESRSPRSLAFFLSVRFLAALAFIMLNWAIAMGSVALINSLQGAQYLFLLLMVLFLSRRYPRVLSEELGGGAMAQKGLGAVLISLGLYLIGFPA